MSNPFIATSKAELRAYIEALPTTKITVCKPVKYRGDKTLHNRGAGVVSHSFLKAVTRRVAR